MVESWGCSVVGLDLVGVMCVIETGFDRGYNVVFVLSVRCVLVLVGGCVCGSVLSQPYRGCVLCMNPI